MKAADRSPWQLGDVDLLDRFARGLQPLSPEPGKPPRRRLIRSWPPQPISRARRARNRTGRALDRH